MKIGIRIPSLKKRIAARTSVKRYIRQNLGVKAPRGYGWLTNPHKAIYNRIYHRTTKGCGTHLLMLITIVLALGAMIILTTCAPSLASIQTAIAGTQAVWTPVPTSTLYPTYTYYPTYTLLPTLTPTPFPSPTTTPVPVSAGDIITAFKAAGLEAENARPMTKDDYGMAPYVCQGTRFFIPSLGPDNGGRLFICDNQGDIDALAGFYQALGKSSAALFSWVFVKGNIVVQINGDLPAATTQKYEAAIP